VIRRLVILGASGDLTARYLLPALGRLVEESKLTVRELPPRGASLGTSDLGPRQVFHDPADSEIGGLEDSRRSLRVVEVSQLCDDDVSVLIEPLLERGSFVACADSTS